MCILLWVVSAERPHVSSKIIISISRSHLASPYYDKYSYSRSIIIVETTVYFILFYVLSSACLDVTSEIYP